MSQSEEKNQNNLQRIVPRYGTYLENEKVILQVALPGVSKENIKMKALKDYFTLRALRDDIQYNLDLDFGVRIEPESTTSSYSEGLLKVEFKRYNPLEHAYLVPIQ